MRLFSFAGHLRLDNASFNLSIRYQTRNEPAGNIDQVTS